MKQKRKIPALDKYVVFSFVCLILFTITEIIVQAITGMEQTALITGFYGCFGGELLLLAMIKRLKLRRGDKDE